MFWALWYIAIPLLAVMVLISALGRLKGRVKHTFKKHHVHTQPIRANDVIDVDFKEVK